MLHLGKISQSFWLFQSSVSYTTAKAQNILKQHLTGEVSFAALRNNIPYFYFIKDVIIYLENSP